MHFFKPLRAGLFGRNFRPFAISADVCRFEIFADRFSNFQTSGNFSQSQLVEMLALPAGEEEKFIEQKAAEGTPVEDMTVKQLRAQNKCSIKHYFLNSISCHSANLAILKIETPAALSSATPKTFCPPPALREGLSIQTNLAFLINSSFLNFFQHRKYAGTVETVHFVVDFAEFSFFIVNLFKMCSFKNF